MTRRAVWETVYKRFDPFRPADNPAWRAERVRSPASRIVQRVAMPFGDTRALVTGTTGTGKSTELLRIAEARSGQDFVIVLDLHRHFAEVVGDEQALRNVGAWEVVFLAGLALVRAASELLPYPIPASYVADLSAAWEKVARATETPGAQAVVDAGALAKAMVVLASAGLPLLGAPAAAAGAVGLKVLEAASGALKWNLPIGQAARRRRDQDAEMQTLLQAVNVLIGHVQSKAVRILLLIDGLDRIVELDRAEALFIESEMIAQLECRVVVSGPFALRSSPVASAIPRFNLILPLVNEPVMDHRDPTQRGPGLDFFCELYARRTADLGAPALLARPELERLAYYSGGRARDFVKLVRALAEQAWLDDAPSATPALVDAVLDSMRRLLETGLDEGHIEVLEAVMANPRHRIPSDARARELLTYGHLLPYPNESEWYYPHPLLTMHLLRPTARSTSGSA
ncbi:hypothetical protein BE17_40720 [Sorangium cellulosum]|uniref:Uncharacterized protein n=1 Tax=Sorangium cellulosum TaxID=56 RepID=A0A150RR52_SORCE|nr:hypothetical protein BE17_40720 [Sorangium cellulosum]